MKIGIIISAVILAIVGLITLVTSGVISGPPESPTRATSPERLVRQTLPADLPTLHTSTNPDDDAAYYYTDAIAFQKEQRRRHLSGRPLEPIDDMIALLKRAADAGGIGDGFLDQSLPVKPGAQPEYGDALDLVAGEAVAYAAGLEEDKNGREAAEVARAVFVFGHRAFTRNTRLEFRVLGLSLMQDGLAILYRAADAGITTDVTADDVAAWADPIQKVLDAWDRKMRDTVRTLKPNIGDLLVLAKDDEDLTFRVEATLKLGVMRFNPKTRGNKKAIQKTLSALTKDANPMIAEAAEASLALTVEDVRKIR